MSNGDAEINARKVEEAGMLETSETKTIREGKGQLLTRNVACASVVV